MKESPLQRDIRLHLGQKADLVLWRNTVGRVFDERSQNWIPYGLCVGSSDLIGILAPMGRFFAAEIKAEGGRTQRERAEQQRLFRELINRQGGYGCEIRSVPEAEVHYQRARQGLKA